MTTQQERYTNSQGRIWQWQDAYDNGSGYMESAGWVLVAAPPDPGRACTCGSGSPWASCAAESQYCG